MEVDKIDVIVSFQFVHVDVCPSITKHFAFNSYLMPKESLQLKLLDFGT